MTTFQTPKQYMEQENIVKNTEKDEPIPDVWKKNSENTRAEKRPAGCFCIIWLCLKAFFILIR